MQLRGKIWKIGFHQLIMLLSCIDIYVSGFNGIWLDQISHIFSWISKLITFFQAIYLIDIYLFLDLLKFIYSEKATKIEICLNLMYNLSTIYLYV